MDAYINDMVVKSKRESDHVRDLTEVFNNTKKTQIEIERGEVCLWGELENFFGILGDETRDRGDSKTNYSNQ